MLYLQKKVLGVGTTTFLQGQGFAAVTHLILSRASGNKVGLSRNVACIVAMLCLCLWQVSGSSEYVRRGGSWFEEAYVSRTSTADVTDTIS